MRFGNLGLGGMLSLVMNLEGNVHVDLKHAQLRIRILWEQVQ